MNYIKCPKCGKEDPAFDYAHVCGPVEVKRTVMNERIRKLAIDAGGHGMKMSTIGLSLLGPDSIQKFAELIVKEMLVTCVEHPTWTGRMIGNQIKEHFGVEE